RYLPPDEEAGFGALITSQGPLPLQAMDIQGRIDGLLAQVTLKQTFVNTRSDPLTATYHFPLPERAAVTGFGFVAGDRLLEGELADRKRSGRAYDSLIRSDARAAA